MGMNRETTSKTILACFKKEMPGYPISFPTPMAEKTAKGKCGSSEPSSCVTDSPFRVLSSKCIHVSIEPTK